MPNRDFLLMHPEITLNPDSSPKQFIDQLESSLDSSSRFSVVHSSKDGMIYGVGVIVEDDTEYDGQRLSLIVDPEGEKVDITVMDPMDGSHDENDYREIRNGVISPIMDHYNKIYNTNNSSRLRSRSKYTLPPKTEEKFKAFTETANKSNLHPTDWEKFYDFIRFCHAYGVKLSESRLRELLQKEGFSSEQARHLGEVYDHGRGILQNDWFRLA